MIQEICIKKIKLVFISFQAIILNLDCDILRQLFRTSPLISRESIPSLKRLYHYIKKYLNNLFYRTEKLEKIKLELKSFEEIPSSDEDDILETDSPIIGEDINLEDLSDLNSGDEGKYDKDDKRTNRKRTNRSFTIKRNDKGETGLHVAAARGNLTLVKSLINQGHPLNVKDTAGWLPLHEAANHGHTDIVAVLVDAGADPNDKGGTGISPLHDAAANGYLEVIEILLKKGASTAQKTNKGETALQLLQACKTRVEKAQGYLDPQVEAHFEKVVQKLKVPDELITKGNKSQISDNPQQELDESVFITDSIDVDDLPSSNSDRCKDKQRNLRTSREFTPSPTGSHLTSNSSSSDEESAAKEYQKAINNLRTKTSKQNLKLKIVKPISRDNRKQFLEETEVGDDWLEKDIIDHPNKKRKFYHIDSREGEQKRSRCDDYANKHSSSLFSKSVPNNTIRKSSSPIREDSSINKYTTSQILFGDDDDDDFVPSGLSNNAKENVEIIKSKLTSTKQFSTQNKPISKSQQITSKQKLENQLLTKVFGSKEHLSIVDQKSSPQKSNSVLELVTSTNTQNFSEYTQMKSIKIKIEAHTFLIPVKEINTLKIDWLKHEASERYYRIEGVTPQMRIKTEDGAIVDDNDPLLSIINEPVVYTEVTSWNKPPLINRYYQICANDDISTHRHFEQTIDNNNTTFTICPCYKTQNVLSSLFKTILHWSELTELNLSRSYLRDINIKTLSENFVNLNKLQILNISCNQITHIGVKYISENSNSLNQLREINISYNPLENNVFTHLNKILNTCVFVNNLNLSNTSITRIDTNINLYNIEHINLSYNRLGKCEISKLLSLLNCEQIISINLSHTLKNKQNIAEFEDTMNKLFEEQDDHLITSPEYKNYSLIEDIELSQEQTPEKDPYNSDLVQNKIEPSKNLPKSPNLFFESKNKFKNTLAYNLPDIISMVPRNTDVTSGNDIDYREKENDIESITTLSDTINIDNNKLINENINTINNSQHEINLSEEIISKEENGFKKYENLDNKNSNTTFDQHIIETENIFANEIDENYDELLKRLQNCSPVMTNQDDDEYTDISDPTDLQNHENCKQTNNVIKSDKNQKYNKYDSGIISNISENISAKHNKKTITYKKNPNSKHCELSIESGITREIVLFLEDNNNLKLNKLLLSNINMINEEAAMLYEVIKTYNVHVDVTGNFISQDYIDMFKCVGR